jgi:hypothetical protein
MPPQTPKIILSLLERVKGFPFTSRPFYDNTA